MADDPAKKPLTEENPSKPADPALQRLKSESEDDSSEKTRHTSGGSPKPKLYKQISTESRGKHGSGGKLVKGPSGGSLPKTGSDASFGRAQPRQRTFSTGSRVSYVSYSARRPSLSLSHSDAIPYYMEKPTKEEIDLEKVPWWTSKRVLLSGTCFIGMFLLYALRVNISIAIVAMVKSDFEMGAAGAGNVTNGTVSVFNSTTNTTYTVNATTTTIAPEGDDCPKSEGGGTKVEGTFEWDRQLRGLILGAFFWGYTVMQIPSGFLSDRFGPRLTIACGMFPVAIFTIITPFLARGSPYLLLVGRVIIGFGEAMMYPGMQSLWARWSPPHERSRLVGTAFGGSQLGVALTFPLAGLLCAYGFDGGWPSVFYIFGLVGFLWCCLFVFYARNSPGEMPGITQIEKDYIEKSLGVYGQTDEDRKKSRQSTKPWKKIFTSGAVWAILLANACGNYGAYMIMTQIPTYMKDVLKFDIKSNGAFSMIPYLVFWMFTIIAGKFADFFITREILSIEWTRKLCCAIGVVMPGIFLIITGYMDCHRQVAAIVLLSLSMGFCGFQFSSFFINHGDIAPKYAGTVFGFTNTGASVPGIIAPYIVGAITTHGSVGEWRITFYIAGVIYCLGAVVYAFLAKGEVLDWAREEVDQVPEFEGHPLKELKEINEDAEDEATEKDKMVDPDKKNGVVFE